MSSAAELYKDRLGATLPKARPPAPLSNSRNANDLVNVSYQCVASIL